MGASSSVLSLSSLSAGEIGEIVAGLGPAYVPYKNNIVENGISGGMIASTAGESELLELLADLSINNNLHKKVIVAQFQQFKHKMEGNGHIVQPPSAQELKKRAAVKLTRESVRMADSVGDSPRVIMTKLFMLQGIKVDPSDLDPSFQILESVIGKGHGDGVNSYDCFINYRVATEADVAEKLYLYLRSNGIHAFLDRKCLKNGQNWKDGFLTGPLFSLTFLQSINVLNH